MIKHSLLGILLLVLFPFMLLAAEVENIRPQQIGNRILFEYDLTGDEEAEVTLTITVKDTVYTQDRLHLEGDYGKVRPGRNKKIYWNVLQDFPKGLSTTFDWELEAGGKQFKDPVTGMEFVFVKGGCFEMGDTFGGGDADEKPVHNICISDFYMGKYEVTVGQFKKFVEDTNYRTEAELGDGCYIFTGRGWKKESSKNWRNPGFTQSDSHPVACVSWNDANSYIQWISRKTNKTYRLPTEAEWEYAARSGGKREKYAGTNDNPDDYVWYNSNSGMKTHPIGEKKPNGLGLYDMSGNVWEWVSDWFGKDYYSNSPRDNPGGPSSGSHRVCRGGSWFGTPLSIRASNRIKINPSSRYHSVGFRLLRTP